MKINSGNAFESRALLSHLKVCVVRSEKYMFMKEGGIPFFVSLFFIIKVILFCLSTE